MNAAVDPDLAPLYIHKTLRWGRQVADSLAEQIALLEQRVDALMSTCARLQRENRMLRDSQASLNSDRAALLEKNETARSRIESMISRLKALEQH